MTHEQRKVYEDKIDNLVAEKSRADCSVKAAEMSLADYYKELEAIKEKYGYDTKHAQLNNYKRQLYKASSQITTVKLQYICHMIQDLRNGKLFSSNTHVMMWLYNNFHISFNDCDRSFESLYADVISSDDFDHEDWEYNEDEYHGYKIFHEWYWRNEDDGWACIVIPENIVNNLNTFIANFNKGIEEIKSKKEKDAIKKKAKEHEEQYKLYLELKQRFGD